ncbi:MAG: NADH-quinone oxidoreductase subunit NuoF [Candidatus Metalachnospira sp.]|nr:NADH-quinone oxidoreductase subunit NuoF [Candidatus Metalachnospira sp.]
MKMNDFLIKTEAQLEEIKNNYTSNQNKYDWQIFVCGGAGCVSSDCATVNKTLKKAIKKYKLENKVNVITTGCMGMCAQGPEILVYPGGTFYVQMDSQKTYDVIERHIISGEIAEEYTFFDKHTQKHIPKIDDIPFYSEQVRIVLRNCGRIDFSSIDAYISRDGYKAVANVLKTDRQKIIDEMKASGLRGRGGAGFPTGVKWQAGKDAKGDKKSIVCNADEGDPGAFMDRSVLEGDPHSIIEGMMIAGYAIGAENGYVYVRAEYPLAVERLGEAIKQAEECGLLGKNIFGTDFSFDIEIRIGAGAFVCGEETALLASIEGKRGEPRQKPPFPFESGLFGQPTIINNVETLANVPAIMLNGAKWYASYGTEKSCGTKVFAMAGDIVNAGIIEVPMGIPLRNIIFTIGGGIPDNKGFKAVQTGGPSGGCLTKDHLDVQVDYESLSALGAIIGSGGMVVMNDESCMVDTARYFLDFTRDESCGRCTPCRIGTKRMLELLEKIIAGNGEKSDIEMLEELAHTIQETAMCGLGQTAPNPVLTTLKYFRKEYEDHINKKVCEAKQCKAMITYAIDPNKCIGCDICKKTCPLGAIRGEFRRPHIIDPYICSRCGSCKAVCRVKAIEVH